MLFVGKKQITFFFFLKKEPFPFLSGNCSKRNEKMKKYVKLEEHWYYFESNFSYYVPEN